jgi:hypothetical protein
VPKQINNADAARELVQQYDLKGRVQLLLDETVVPVVVVGDVTEPIDEGVLCGLGGGAASVAAEFGFAGAAGVPGVDLTVKELTISNKSGANRSYEIRAYTTADLAAMGVSLVPLRSFESRAPSPGAIAGPVQMGSSYFFGTHTLNSLGTLLLRAQILDQLTQRFPLDFLVASENLTQVAALGAIELATNSSCDVSVICRQLNA